MSSTRPAANASAASSGPPMPRSCCAFRAAHLLGVELARQAGAGGGHGLQRARVHDLVRSAPDLREVPHDLRLPFDVHRLPDAQHLVHPAAEQLRSDRALEIVDERVHLLVGRRPVEPAVRVGDVAVKRRDGGVGQAPHGPQTRPAARGRCSRPPGCRPTRGRRSRRRRRRRSGCAGSSIDLGVGQVDDRPRAVQRQRVLVEPVQLPHVVVDAGARIGRRQCRERHLLRLLIEAARIAAVAARDARRSGRRGAVDPHGHRLRPRRAVAGDVARAGADERLALGRHLDGGALLRCRPRAAAVDARLMLDVVGAGDRQRHGGGVRPADRGAGHVRHAGRRAVDPHDGGLRPRRAVACLVTCPGAHDGLSLVRHVDLGARSGRVPADAAIRAALVLDGLAAGDRELHGRGVRPSVRRA